MKLDVLRKIIKEELASVLKENENVETKYSRIQKTTGLNKQNGEVINNMFIYPDPNGKETKEKYLSLEKRKGMDKFKVTVCKDKKEAEAKAAALKENTEVAPAKTKPGTKETTKPGELTPRIPGNVPEPDKRKKAKTSQKEGMSKGIADLVKKYKSLK